MGNYAYAFLDEATRGHDHGGDDRDLYYIPADEEVEFVCDDADRLPRPRSAPPDL
jgi:hypothetical protein